MKTVTASQLRNSVTKYTNEAQAEPIKVTSVRKGEDAYLVSKRTLNSNHLTTVLTLRAKNQELTEQLENQKLDRHVIAMANAKLRKARDKYKSYAWLYGLLAVALFVALWVK